MAIKIQVPPLGESVTQAVLVSWHKQDGDTVAMDEPICELETDKANVDLPAKGAGVLRRLKNEGETVNVGEVVAEIDENGAAAKASKPAVAVGAPTDGLPTPAQSSSAPTAEASPVPTAAVRLEDLSPAVRRLVEENKLDPTRIPATGPGGRLTKEDVQAYLEELKRMQEGPRPAPAPPQAQPAPQATAIAPPPTPVRPAVSAKPQPAPAAPGGGLAFDEKGIAREPMSKIRKRIAETLVQAKQTAAILTTFNEVDLSEVLSLRAKFKDQFEKTHGIGLGFMSFFAKAIVRALQEVPRLNAFIEGDDIVYHNYVNLGIAVSTERGLAVPVLRNVQDMSFAKIEQEIKRLATAVRDGKLGLEELSGGTFSITNGGVFGSLLSTPILTPPQSGILGMHTIQKRPVVINDKIEVRSMMYIALSYDHRLVDGKEAITFLVRVKQMLEDPARLLLEV